MVARNASKLRRCVRQTAVVGRLESSGWLCVDTFGRNLALVAVKMFSHFAYFEKKFYISLYFQCDLQT
jgi:hypothetical protein